ncbi:MAG: metallophosphoesterase [Alicyclobacillus sp.]|nr:metallophosphoesterase [Alicyclobacillus sp.]
MPTQEEAIPVQTPLIRFAVLSDLHFMVWKETHAPVEWVPTLEHALEDLTGLGPDFLVINGDLTNGKERDYELAMRIIRRTCPLPVMYTMGNHEYYGYYEDEPFSFEGARERFLRHTGQDAIYYSRDIAGFSFLFLSTERYTPDLKDAGWLSNEQLAWLDRELGRTERRPVYAFFHQPLNGTVANSAETCCQSDELRQILRKYPGVLWFTGHTHCRMDRSDQLVEQDGTWFIGGGCVCGDTPQSRWVEVYPDRTVLRIRDHMQDNWVSGFDAVIPFPSPLPSPR